MQGDIIVSFFAKELQKKIFKKCYYLKYLALLYNYFGSILLNLEINFIKN